MASQIDDTGPRPVTDAKFKPDLDHGVGVQALPPWKLMLHHDDENEFMYVVDTITMLTPLQSSEATRRKLEAQHEGVAPLLTTHRERAELYVNQFGRRNLTVSIEPA